MNQHHIQAAYLKEFKDQDKIHVYSSTDLNYLCKKPIKWCTSQEDFQNINIEIWQNQFIENPGIKALRCLLQKSEFNEDKYSKIIKWIALHLVRNQKRKKLLFESKDQYNNNFHKEFQIDLAYLNYYKYLDTYTCSNNDFFITSDNPILEIHPDDKMALIMPISPKKLIHFSSDGRKIQHTKLSYPDFVNSMTLVNSYKYIYSDRKLVKLNQWKENAIELEMAPIYEELKFVVKEFD